MKMHNPPHTGEIIWEDCPDDPMDGGPCTTPVGNRPDRARVWDGAVTALMRP
jgi:hypothetical protein